MELPALKVGKPRPTPVVRGGITEIIRNWKKKRQDRKQAKHEKLLVELAENNVRSVKVMSDESIAAGYMDYLHKQKKDNKF